MYYIIYYNIYKEEEAPEGRVWSKGKSGAGGDLVSKMGKGLGTENEVG